MNLQREREELLLQLSREIRDKRVLQAMERVPREAFVPLAYRHQAYADTPLPIGQGQTISQPLIVALMTEALELTGSEKVLEIGTGSGYQTAILAELARHVVSVERIPELAEGAQRLLSLLGYGNVEVQVARWTLGWAEAAPYDAILVTAGAPQVPSSLLRQLGEGGRLVIPAGSRQEQRLLKLVKEGDRTRQWDLGPCRFVPLVGEESWPEEGEVSG